MSSVKLRRSLRMVAHTCSPSPPEAGVGGATGTLFPTDPRGRRGGREERQPSSFSCVSLDCSVASLQTVEIASFRFRSIK